MTVMQELTDTDRADHAAFMAARGRSMQLKIDPHGEIKMHLLRNKFGAFCDVNEIERMDWNDIDEDFLQERGLREDVKNRDAIIKGIAVAYVDAPTASASAVPVDTSNVGASTDADDSNDTSDAMDVIAASEGTSVDASTDKEAFER